PRAPPGSLSPRFPMPPVRCESRSAGTTTSSTFPTFPTPAADSGYVILTSPPILSRPMSCKTLATPTSAQPTTAASMPRLSKELPSSTRSTAAAPFSATQPLPTCSATPLPLTSRPMATRLPACAEQLLAPCSLSRSPTEFSILQPPPTHSLLDPAGQTTITAI